ncbi:hypothetical protein VYU27_010508, partial [Nannochloropsis oceanica]
PSLPPPQAKERELRGKRSSLYQLAVLEAKNNIQGLEKKHAALSERLLHEQTKMGKSEAELAAFEEGFARVQAEYGGLAEALGKAKDEFNAFERRDIKLQEDEKFLKTGLKKIKAQVEKEKKKGAEAQATAETKDAAIPSLEKAAVKASEAKVQAEAAVEDIMEGVKGKTNDLRRELEAAQEALAPIKETSVARKA